MCESIFFLDCNPVYVSDFTQHIGILYKGLHLLYAFIVTKKQSLQKKLTKKEHQQENRSYLCFSAGQIDENISLQIKSEEEIY